MSQVEEIILNELLAKISDLYDEQLFEIESYIDGSDFVLTISYAKDDTPRWRKVDLNNPESINILQKWLTDIITSWLAWETFDD